MSSHDDPEERIRELERSLGDRAAELTQSSAEGRYAPYPPPPYSAPSYGVPYPAAPTSSGGGISKGWLVAGVLMMITVGLVAGAVSFFNVVFSSVDIPSRSPSVSGGGGPFGQPPTPSGANPPQITMAEPTASAAPPGGDVSVSGVGENRTIECNDGNVGISGVSNTVVLTGHCASVTISGIQNVVTIDESDSISASGFDNRVTYRSGSPDVENSGGSNVIEQG